MTFAVAVLLGLINVNAATTQVTLEQALPVLTGTKELVPIIAAQTQPAASTAHHGTHPQDFQPEQFLNQVLGVQTNTTKVDQVRSYLQTQLELSKQEMLIDYAENLIELETEIRQQATALKSCNWACVDTCATTAVDLRSRVSCLDTCGCYSATQQAQVQPVANTLPYQALFAVQTQQAPQYTQAELDEMKLEADYSAQELALEQKLAKAEQDLKLRYEAEKLALETLAVGTVDPLADLQNQLKIQQLDAAHKAQLLEVRGNITDEGNAAYIAYRERSIAFEQAEDEAELNTTSTLASTLPANLRDLYLQREREELAREKIITQVELSLERVTRNRAAKAQDFQAALDNAVTQLGCDALCVSTCSALQATLNGKAGCLDKCLCYDAPQKAAPTVATKEAAPVVVGLANPLATTEEAAPIRVGLANPFATKDAAPVVVGLANPLAITKEATITVTPIATDNATIEVASRIVKVTPGELKQQQTHTIQPIFKTGVTRPQIVGLANPLAQKVQEVASNVTETVVATEVPVIDGAVVTHHADGSFSAVSSNPPSITVETPVIDGAVVTEHADGSFSAVSANPPSITAEVPVIDGAVVTQHADGSFSAVSANPPSISAETPVIEGAVVTTHADGSFSAVSANPPSISVETPVIDGAVVTQHADGSFSAVSANPPSIVVTTDTVAVDTNATVVDETLNATLTLSSLDKIKEKSRALKRQAQEKAEQLVQDNKHVVVGLAQPLAEQAITQATAQVTQQAVQQASSQAEGFLAQANLAASTQAQTNVSFPMLMIIAFLVACIGAFVAKSNMKRKQNVDGGLNEYLLIKA